MSITYQPNGAAVKFENVTVALGGNTILDDVLASVPQGSCTAIVGPNGAGKTTMLLALLGQLPHTGSIRISRAPEGRHPRIGYVPQRLQFDRGMPITLLEFMVMGWQRIPTVIDMKVISSSTKEMDSVSTLLLMEKFTPANGKTATICKGR